MSTELLQIHSHTQAMSTELLQIHSHTNKQCPQNFYKYTVTQTSNVHKYTVTQTSSDHRTFTKIQRYVSWNW